MTHGKPCVTRHAKENACVSMAKENACVTHGLPCVHMHVNVEVYKRVRKPVRRGGEQKKGKEGKKKEEKKREKEKKGRQKEGNRNLTFLYSKIGFLTVKTRRTKK